MKRWIFGVVLTAALVGCAGRNRSCCSSPAVMAAPAGCCPPSAGTIAPIPVPPPTTSPGGAF